MHIHGVFVPEDKAPLEGMSRLNWYVDRKKDERLDRKKRDILMRRPRTRSDVAE